MYSRWGTRNRRVLIALVLLSIAILTLYYRGNGKGIVDYSQRLALEVVTPVQRLTFTVAQPFRRAWGYAVAVRREQGANERLRRANRRLKAQLKQLKDYQAENERLRNLVAFKQATPFDFLPSRVIARSPSNWQSVVSIDVGRGDGVNRGMPVVTADGVVGQVVQASAHAAQVQLIDDQKSGVAVEIERTGQMGVVEGRVDRQLVLRFVGKDADVRVGDRLRTAGIGGVYPRGLVVGRVGAVENSQYALEKLVRVRAAVNSNKLAEVLVIRGQIGAR